MARHVCGTCRFFRPTEPNAKSGWCSHPQKQTTTDVRILVRSGELNCRDDWDHDLWQLREDNDRVLDVTMLKAADPGDASSRPRRSEGTRTLGQDDVRSDPPAMPVDDVLVEQGDEPPRLVSEDLNRELLRRAREQYRARRQSSRPGGPSPRLSDDSAPTLHRSEPIVISNDVQPLPIGQPLPPDLSRLTRRERSSAGSPPERVDSGAPFSSIPIREETVELPRPSSERTDEIPAVDDFTMETLRGYDEAVEARRAGELSATQPAHPEIAPRPPSRARRAEDWESELVDRSEEDDPAQHGRRLSQERRFADEHEPFSARAPQSETEWSADPDDLRPWDYVEPRRPRAGDVETRDIARTATPSSSRLWDDIPRCCRTCRDFRPAETGGRGWCTNRWAFRHRRMVDIDELPCETTIGAWWLPTDDAWQDDPDIGRHVQATPLMDRWIGRVEEDREPLYPAVASRTRRRP